MASYLPQLSGKEFGKALLQLGFQLKSRKGSHMKFARSVGGGEEIIIVPDHRTLRKGTLFSILKQLRLSAEELRNLI